MGSEKTVCTKRLAFNQEAADRLFFCAINLIIMLDISIICHEVTARIGTALTVFGRVFPSACYLLL